MIKKLVCVWYLWVYTFNIVVHMVLIKHFMNIFNTFKSLNKMSYASHPPRIQGFGLTVRNQTHFYLLIAHKHVKMHLLIFQLIIWPWESAQKLEINYFWIDWRTEVYRFTYRFRRFIIKLNNIYCNFIAVLCFYTIKSSLLIEKYQIIYYLIIIVYSLMQMQTSDFCLREFLRRNMGRVRSL